MIEQYISAKDFIEDDDGPNNSRDNINATIGKGKDETKLASTTPVTNEYLLVSL